MPELVLVGAGGFAREAAAAVRAVNDVAPTWRLRGFLDDDPALHGTERAGLPILGGIDELAEHPDAEVVVCVASHRNLTARERVVERLALPTERYATVVHPAANLGHGARVGSGSVVLAGVTVTADAHLGQHVLVMPQTVVTHDDVVEDFAALTSGVRLGGAVTVGRGAYLGAGCLIRESVTIGHGALVGMGAVVLHDVPPGQVWVGHPARFLRCT